MAIYAYGWTCYRCKTLLKISEPNATGDLFIDPDPSRTMALCKNSIECTKRQEAD